MKNKKTKKVPEVVELSLYHRRKLAKARKAAKEVRDARKARKLKEERTLAKHSDTASKPKLIKNKKSKKQGPETPILTSPKITKTKPVKTEVITPPVVEAPVIVLPVVPKKVNYLNNRDLLAEVKASKKQGEMTNKLARMLVLLCAKYAKKGNFINYCVDSETTALTKQGWKTHQEITIDDQILSYNIETGQMVWSKVLEVFRNMYSGPMHHLTTQGMDALVTPNHKFVSIERGLIPVEEIICNEHIVLMGDAVDDGDIVHSDADVEVVGWCITEGHYSTKSKKRHSISISQKQGPKADRIREVLHTARIPHKEYVNKHGIVIFNCTGKWISEIHSHIAPNRVLSSNFIVNLVQRQRLLLIQTMVAGDGWIRPSGGMSYVQKCPKHVDALIMLCTIAGLTTSVTPMTYKTPASKKQPSGGLSDVLNIDIYATPKKVCRAEWIDFHGGKQTPGGRREDKPNTPTQNYNGLIWCPRTEYGTFLCRKNNYVYVTGNTYNDDMQGYAMMMLVRTWNSFDPARSENAFAFYTQCIKSSFIQYLNQEKRQRTIRDLILVDQGMNPSFAYQGEGSDQHILEDEQDFYAQKHAADALTRLPQECDDPEDQSKTVDDTPPEPNAEAH